MMLINILQYSMTCMLEHHFAPGLFEIFTHLKYANATSYLVGGCVRDYLLGNVPTDYDIVTDCPIPTIIELLGNNGWKINEAGKLFLVLIVSKNGHQYEIANFRKDSTYVDGRRPSSVDIGNLNEDAERRDISINSLYYDPYTGEVLDPTNKGLADLHNKIIRMNGNPVDRISEDLLRIMRVYRFSSTLNFTIHKKTLTACRNKFNDMLIRIPGERIRSELEKMSGGMI